MVSASRVKKKGSENDAQRTCSNVSVSSDNSSDIGTTVLADSCTDLGVDDVRTLREL